jgi:hypothetical protein
MICPFCQGRDAHGMFKGGDFTSIRIEPAVLNRDKLQQLLGLQCKHCNRVQC